MSVSFPSPQLEKLLTSLFLRSETSPYFPWSFFLFSFSTSIQSFCRWKFWMFLLSFINIFLEISSFCFSNFRPVYSCSLCNSFTWLVFSVTWRILCSCPVSFMASYFSQIWIAVLPLVSDLFPMPLWLYAPRFCRHSPLLILIELPLL